MQQSETRKLKYSDIGYHGKTIDALTREELLDAFLELAQTVQKKHGNSVKTLLRIMNIKVYIKMDLIFGWITESVSSNGKGGTLFKQLFLI